MPPPNMPAHHPAAAPCGPAAAEASNSSMKTAQPPILGPLLGHPAHHQHLQNVHPEEHPAKDAPEVVMIGQLQAEAMALASMAYSSGRPDIRMPRPQPARLEYFRPVR